jgi:hypothetical protein
MQLENTTTNIDGLIGKYLVLTKMEDRVYEGNHPNKVNIGSSDIQGFLKNDIEIGEQLYLYPTLKFQIAPCAWTSSVESFDIEKMELRTKNSLYTITIK